MKTLLPMVTALVLGAELTGHAETALSALRALSKADTRNVIEVTARHAGASPEHWDFTIFDPATLSHQRKLEVERGAVVASQAIPGGSAGGAALEPWDAGVIRVDSDRAAGLALAYAKSNGISYASIDYELRRQGANAVPVWIVTCLDAKAQPLGSVVITSSGGDVVASEGFARGPVQSAGAAAPVPAQPGPRQIAASGLSQLMRSDQEFLDSQPGRSPAAPVAVEQIPDESPAPVAERDEPRPARVVTKVKPSEPPATRVAVRKREVPPGGFIDDSALADGGRLASRPPPYETRGRVEVREVDDDWAPVYDDAPRKKIHIGRFFHRLFSGDN